MDLAIETTGIHKTFVKKRSIRELITAPFRRAKRIHALRGVDLDVRQGEIFGLLGPNGAGKTTMLKVLSCLIIPDQGQAMVGGDDTRRENLVKPTIGLVHSDERSFYWRLSGRENLQFFATLYNVPHPARKSRIEMLLERVDMSEAADRRFSDYSSGMKQRMSIARALLHDPPILLMDEPTRSLDPASAASLRKFIAEDLSGKDAKTIILATHNLREAEALCHRIAILVKGRVRQIGTVDEVRRWGVDEKRYRLDLTAWPEELGNRYQVIREDRTDDILSVEISIGREHSLNSLLGALIEAGVQVHNCDRVEPDLEDAFARIMQEEDGEGGEQL